MTVRRTVRAAAVLAAAAVLVTACGNGDDGDDLAGVDQADEAGAGDSEDAEDSESDEGEDEEEEPADGEPVFDFPDNFDVVIEDDLTGDEETDELLRDHGYALKAMRESYVHQEGTENFLEYWTAPVDSDYLFDFDDFAEQGWTLVGVIEVYAREVVKLDEGYAVIEFCENTANARGEDLETGETVEAENSGEYGEFEEYRDHRMELERSESGHWEVAISEWRRGSEGCAQKADS